MSYRATSSRSETTSTSKAVLEVEVLRTETISEIACKCGRKGEYRTFVITPPAALGSRATYHRVSEGWWIHGDSWFGSVKATCPECFKTLPGCLLVANEDDE